jgi:uncharacterized membrane protein
MTQSPLQACYFDAELVPHRSLSPRGFRILMAVVIAANVTVGAVFYFSGAWPVFGFMGLDVGLLYFLFRLNYRNAQLIETLRLTDDAFEVRRRFPNGEELRWTLEPYWLRVELDQPPQHDSKLILVSRRRRLSVGSFLAPEERAEVAHALRAALQRQRQGPRGAPPVPSPLG